MQLHDLEQRVFDRQRDKAVRTAVSKLSPRQRVVIAARFGLDDGWVQTLEQTTATLGKLDGYTVGRERIRQIECRALRHLRYRGGLYDVAGVKNPVKVFDPVAFRRHQQALQATRAAQQRWEEERQSLAEQWQAQQAARARQAAEAYAAEARAERRRFADQAAARWSPWSNPPPAPRPAAVPVQMLPDTPQPTPSNHYDWMQRSRDDLDRWRAGGRPVNPFDWMKS